AGSGADDDDVRVAVGHAATSPLAARWSGKLVKAFTSVARQSRTWGGRTRPAGGCRGPGAGQSGGRTARWRATTPPVRLRQDTRDHPASAIRRASPAWSGHARIDSTRYR